MQASATGSVTLVSANIEGDKHLDAVAAFLKEADPDAFCLQELSAPKVSFFEKELGAKGFFAPMMRKRPGAPPSDPMPPGTPVGVGLFSRLPLSRFRRDYYYGGGRGDPPVFMPGDESTVWRVLLSGSFEKNGKTYAVATTHFTRTPDGSASDKQRTDMKNLLKLLGKFPSIILCGDFNAPRGGEIFAMLAARYADNVPSEYDSSLDPDLHKLKGSKRLMVDGLFSAPEYRIEKTRLNFGVSDHAAITAEVFRV